MELRRVLLLLKRSMLDIYVARERAQMHGPEFASVLHANPKAGEGPSWADFMVQVVVGNLTDRHRVHENTVQVCKRVLERRNMQWECLMRDELSSPIRDVDLVVTIGGDGTLLQASHYLDSSIPVLGVNSDPTLSIATEVEEKIPELDAIRSTGYLCAATADTFAKVLDEILGGRVPSEVTRIRTRIDGADFPIPALNDVLVAHPNPAAVSRCGFSISNPGGLVTPELYCRSSGIRICTAAGSTAAMKSAGGYPMHLLSPCLQYMFREPIMPHPKIRDHLHGYVRPKEVFNLEWGCRQGVLYFDGSHLVQTIKLGSVIEFSPSAPTLRIFIRPD